MYSMITVHWAGGGGLRERGEQGHCVPRKPVFGKYSIIIQIFELLKSVRVTTPHF